MKARVAIFLLFISTIVLLLNKQQLFADKATAVSAEVNHSLQNQSVASCTTYTSSDVPVNLSNGTTSISSNLSVSNSGTIEDVNVAIDMPHAWPGDLSFTLTHQNSGTAVKVIDRPGVPASTYGCSTDDILVTLDDEAGTAVESQCNSSSPAISGTLSPNNALSAFDGNNSNGTWVLTVEDSYTSADAGSLDGWSIEICTAGAATPTATSTTSPPTATATSTSTSPTATATSIPSGDVFFDDFESAQGWIANPNGTDTATTGQWERANPDETTYSGVVYQQGTTVSGSYDLVTAGAAGSSAGANDIDGGVTSMRSPNIVLPSGTDLNLSFSYYLAHYSNSATDDFLRVTVVGNTSQVVLEELAAADTDAATWASLNASLNAFAGQTVYILIEAADNGGGSLVEAAIDDVRITAGGTIPTPTPTATPSSGSPTLLSPANGSTIAKTVFDWSDVAGASSYRFQLSNSATFGSTVVDQTVSNSQYAYTSNLSGTYYWRTAVSGGAWSSVWTVQLVNYNGDDDGDALPNGWELHGYDANNDGIIDVPLHTMGANYRHKDIFVEMDYMRRSSGSTVLEPNQQVLDRIVQVFANGDISNPDGTTGINIHLEKDDQVPYDSNLQPAWSDFDVIKNNYFDSRRAATHYYMIWADRYEGGTSSGLARNIPASNFIVTLGGWHSGTGGTDDEKVGTFIHELGHAIGLKHGGVDHTNYKPNYISIMSYQYQTKGVYRNGSWGNYDYQRFSLPSLSESNLNESVGLNGGSVLNGYRILYHCNGNSRETAANGGIDWNCNGSVGGNVYGDINNDNSYSTLYSWDDWANIEFGGGGVIGSFASSQLLQEQIESATDTVLMEELTWEEQQSLDAQFAPNQATEEDN